MVHAIPRWENEAQVVLPVGLRRIDLVFIVDQNHALRHWLREPLKGVIHELFKGVDSDISIGLVFASKFHIDFYRLGTDDGRVFWAGAPVGKDEAALAAAVDAWPEGLGGAEAALEAIFQVVTGDGYDIDCNGKFSHVADVRPWISHPSDAFGGTEGGRWEPGLGRGGGAGLRPFSQPVYAFIPAYRWIDGGKQPYFPDSYGLNVEIGGCPEDATTERVVGALQHSNSLFVGVDVMAGTNGQLRDLVERVGSYGDLDGDGASDDLLVLVTPDFVHSPGYEQEIIDGLENIIQAALDARSPEVISLGIDNDPHGFIVDFSPSDIPAAEELTEVEFTVRVRGTLPPEPTDRIHRVSLHAAGDGAHSLGHSELLVVVPGRGLQ